MGSPTSPWQWFCCPFCGGNLDFRESGCDKSETQVFGTLSCFCSRFPVIAGIPILKRNAVGTDDQSTQELVRLIEGGRCQEALMAMLAPSSMNLAQRWIKSMPDVVGFRRLKRLSHERNRQRWVEKAATLATSQESTAWDFLKHVFAGRPEHFNYFAFRFGQPRHLATMSLVSLVRRSEAPLLDAACGCGHLLPSLIRRSGGQPVFGVDSSFFSLFIAHTWVAPDAYLACCDMNVGLPFRNSFFAGILCSDAFHYLVNKSLAVREFRRLMNPHGLLLLTCVRNARADTKNDGFPLPPEAYETLFAGMPHRVVADSAILARYLKKQGPALGRGSGLAELGREVLISIIASEQESFFVDHSELKSWPHGEGTLRLNPLYVLDLSDTDPNVILRRQFPSKLFEEEHLDASDYLPKIVKVKASILEALDRDERPPETEPLVASSVVVGMPERFLKNFLITALPLVTGPSDGCATPLFALALEAMSVI